MLMLREKNQIVGQPLTTMLLLVCGVVSPFLFTIVLVIEGATRPGYNPWVQAGSALSLGAQGWMQITNFIVNGPAGLVERITISIGLAWIVFLAIGLLSKHTSSDEERDIVSHNV